MIGLVLYLVLSIALGGLLCFGGKKIYFILLKVAGVLFITVLCLGKWGFTWPGILAAVLLSALLIFLLEKVYKAAFFLCGMLLGLFLGILVTGFIPEAAAFGWLIILVLAIGLGVCAVKWSGFFITLATAYSGANLIALPLLFLFFHFRELPSFIQPEGLLDTALQLNQYLTGSFTAQHTVLILVASLVLMFIGMTAQKKGDGASEREKRQEA